MPRDLPQEFSFDADQHLLIWRPRGVLDEASVNRAIRCVADLERSSTAPFNRFADATQLDAVDLNFRYVFHVALYRRVAYGRRAPVKTAFLVNHEDLDHYARLHKMLTQGSSINVRIFEEKKAAAEWLDLPVAALQPKAVKKDRERSRKAGAA